MRRAARLEDLADRALAFVGGMRFSFLFDRERQLFAIGYRLADSEGPGRIDPTYYDLLASEARLASFLAIAMEEVPQAHWFRLGRGVRVGRRPADARLVGRVDVRVPDAAAPHEIAPWHAPRPELPERGAPADRLRAVVRRPWGISESGYDLVDRQGQYQYRSFGVPDLGLKRGLADDFVVSPYSTALAAMIDPEAAVKNMRALAQRGLLGRHGFYEALDYTSHARLAGAEEAIEGDACSRRRIAIRRSCVRSSHITRA